MNCFNGIGRITHDLELKENQQKKKYCKFSIAINTGYKNNDGKDIADYINCTAWEKTAENLCKYQKKGSLIGVEGRLHTYSYESDGQKKSTHEVVISHLDYLESKSKSNVPEPEMPPYLNKTPDEVVADVVNNNDPFETMGQIVATESDLPF